MHCHVLVSFFLLYASVTQDTLVPTYLTSIFGTPQHVRTVCALACQCRFAFACNCKHTRCRRASRPRSEHGSIHGVSLLYVASEWMDRVQSMEEHDRNRCVPPRLQYEHPSNRCANDDLFFIQSDNVW